MSLSGCGLVSVRGFLFGDDVCGFVRCFGGYGECFGTSFRCSIIFWQEVGGDVIFCIPFL